MLQTPFMIDVCRLQLIFIWLKHNLYLNIQIFILLGYKYFKKNNITFTS